MDNFDESNLGSLDENLCQCGKCNNYINANDEFCPYCGGVFIDDVNCENHKSVEAEGVCVICNVPFCAQCGTWVNDVFLCAAHSNYEIIQSMARVYGSDDLMKVQYAYDCLIKEGFHPFIFSRRNYGVTGRMQDVLVHQSPYCSEEEIKLMVPLQEVIESERILEELDFNR